MMLEASEIERGADTSPFPPSRRRSVSHRHSRRKQVATGGRRKIHCRPDRSSRPGMLIKARRSQLTRHDARMGAVHRTKRRMRL